MNTNNTAGAAASASRPFYMRNYMILSLEGGLFMGGLAFTDANSVLPRLMEVLGSPSWVISIMPTLMIFGITFPAVLTAHIIEGLPHVKKYLVITGIFQRIPYLFVGLALVLMPDADPTLLIMLVVACPLFSGLSGGITITAFQELVGKSIPPMRMASVFAVRNIIRVTIGLCSGGVVLYVLEKYPGVYGYGILHLITFFFLAISYMVFIMVRETNDHSRKNQQPISFRKNIRLMPKILYSDKRYRHYLFNCIAGLSMFCMLPFFAIYVLRVTGRPDSFMGVLVTTQMAGGITGNIFSGYTGDRFGSKIAVVGTRIVFILACFWTLFASTEIELSAIMFLIGFVYFADFTSRNAFSYEIIPLEKRATYFAIRGFLCASFMVIFSVFGSAIWDWSGQNIKHCTAAACAGAIISLFFILQIKNPRPLNTENHL